MSYAFLCLLFLTKQAIYMQSHNTVQNGNKLLAGEWLDMNAFILKETPF